MSFDHFYTRARLTKSLPSWRMVNLGKHQRSQKAPWLDPQSLRSVKKIAKHLVKILIFLFFRRKRKKRRRMIWKRCRVDCKLSEVRAKGCLLYIQGVFFNWCPPKIHKYGKKLKYQNWCPPKISKYQPVRKFWQKTILFLSVFFWTLPLPKKTLLGGRQLKKATCIFCTWALLGYA